MIMNLDLLLSKRIILLIGLLAISASMTRGFAKVGSDKSEEIGIVKVYPNPILDENIVSVEFERALTGNLKYSIIDQIGNEYLKMDMNIGDPVHKISIDLSGHNLGPGIYFLRIKNDLKPEKVLKIIKK
jgi:hypothetical protein